MLVVGVLQWSLPPYSDRCWSCILWWGGGGQCSVRVRDSDSDSDVVVGPPCPVVLLYCTSHSQPPRRPAQPRLSSASARERERERERVGSSCETGRLQRLCWPQWDRADLSDLSDWQQEESRWCDITTSPEQHGLLLTVQSSGGGLSSLIRTQLKPPPPAATAPAEPQHSALSQFNIGL